MKSELLGTKAFVTIADFGCFTRAADDSIYRNRH